MRRLLPLLLSLLLLGLLGACQKQGTLDLDGLAGQARAGDQDACRELVDLLKTADEALGDRVYAIIITLGKPVIPALLDQVASTNDDQRERVAAALGNYKVREAVPGMIAFLQSPLLKRRYIAAWCLGEIGDDEGIMPLIVALGDPDPLVRKQATRSLIKFNYRATRPLMASLKSDNEVQLAGAIRVLGDIGDRQVIDDLLQLTGGKLRGEVFLALGKLRDPRAESALVAGLSDPDWQVRMNAAMALGTAGSKNSVPPLRLALDDEVMVVREWSARSLSVLTGEPVDYRDASGAMVAPYSVYH